MARLGALAWLVSLSVACTIELRDEEGGSGGPTQPDVQLLPADGVTITEVAIYQAVERVLMKDGAVVQGVPVVAGRDALLRVFYTTDSGYDGEQVLSRLSVSDSAGPHASGSPLERGVMLGKASKQDALGSTIDFKLPGTLITPAAGFRVDLLRPPSKSSGNNSLATHPQQGKQIFAAVAVPKLKIVLVPIRYQADGSSRLPDLSPAQLQMYRDAIWQLYPVSDIDLQVVNPVSFSKAVAPTGSGWVELLDAVTTLRASAKAASDEYYYGIFAPAGSVTAFCGGGCIAGLSHLVIDPYQAWTRAGIGLGFSGEAAGDTAVHEIGHTHGRSHAPCGTGQGLDQSYPYKGGTTGGWGYNVKSNVLMPPTEKDFMSYCKPRWISDYNYGALFSRIQSVTGTMMQIAGAASPRSYERVAILPGGGVRWLDPLQLELAPLGAPEPVQIDTEAGPLHVQGHFFPYSHLDGGTVMFATPPSRAYRVRVRHASAWR